MQACQGRGPPKPYRCPAAKRRAAAAPGEVCPDDTVSQGRAVGPAMARGYYYLDVPRANVGHGWSGLCDKQGQYCPVTGECPVGARFSGEAPCAPGKAPGPVAGFLPPTMVAASNWSRAPGEGAARGFDRGGVTEVHPGEDRVKVAVAAVDAARFKARYPGGAPWAKPELVGLRDEGRRPGRVALPRRASDWTLPAKARLSCVCRKAAAPARLTWALSRNGPSVAAMRHSPQP